MAKKIVILGFENVLFDAVRGLWEEPRAALAELFLNEIPVVLWSSLNRAESVYFRGQLGLQGPYVVEDGAALYVPFGHFDFDVSSRQVDGHETLSFGEPAQNLRAEVSQGLAGQSVPLHFLGDYSVEEVAQMYRIPTHLADLKQRSEFSAAFTTAPYHDESWEKAFTELANQKNRRLFFDGVFYWIQKKIDPADPFEAVVQLFEREFDERPLVVAVGGSAADESFLKLADKRIWLENDRLVTKPDRGPVEACRSKGKGPAAWKEIPKIILEND